MPAGQEIERKFLVDRVPDEMQPVAVRSLVQGYLLERHQGLEVRVRRADDECTLTLKSGSGMVRAEEEIPIEPDRFERLWPLTDGRRIEKLRHVFALPDGLQAEVDVYAGALHGLLTAEVEFGSEDAAQRFVAPAWMGRDVSGDPRYSNGALARDGLPA